VWFFLFLCEFSDFRAIFSVPVRFLSVQGHRADKMLTGRIVFAQDGLKLHRTAYFVTGGSILAQVGQLPHRIGFE